MAGFIIGVAGYMGSGKTTFCTMLAQYTAATIFDGDNEAKQLMQEHYGIKEELCTAFGSDVIDASQINFRVLGKLAFSSLQNLQKLNRIVHPVLLASLEKTIFNHQRGCLVVDAALLPLWSIESWFDRCIWIDSPSTCRSERILAKGILPETEILRRMQQQEALFAVPGFPPWSRFENDTTIEMLQKKAHDFASTLPSSVDK